MSAQSTLTAALFTLAAIFVAGAIWPTAIPHLAAFVAGILFCVGFQLWSNR